MQSTLTIYGDDILADYFGEVAARVEFQVDRPMEQIADDVERLFAQAFGGTPDLIESRYLLNSLTEYPSEDGVRNIESDLMERGTRVWYARFHKGRLMADVESKTTVMRWLDHLNNFIEHGTRASSMGLGL